MTWDDLTAEERVFATDTASLLLDRLDNLNLTEDELRRFTDVWFGDLLTGDPRYLPDAARLSALADLYTRRGLQRDGR